MDEDAAAEEELAAALEEDAAADEDAATLEDAAALLNAAVELAAIELDMEGAMLDIADVVGTADELTALAVITSVISKPMHSISGLK